MNTTEDIITVLKLALQPLNLYTAILFGSYAYGTPQADSDIDILTVLNKSEPPRNYSERRENRLIVRRALDSLNYEYPLDILVYTLPEWEGVLHAQSSFICEVLEKGVRL